MTRDRRLRRDRHGLDENGMVLCNPRDREAAHRAEMEGIATHDLASVTCQKCLDLLHRKEKAEREHPERRGVRPEEVTNGVPDEPSDR